MGLILNGNAPSKMLYNGAEVSLYFNGSKIWPEEAPSFDEVTIGTQTWMTKNLSINDGGTGIYTQTVNYGQGDVVEYYYTWAAAKRIANSINGWHLPSNDEWNALVSTLGSSTAGTKLKSTYGWTDEIGRDVNGTDDFGFSVFPAGYRKTNGTYSELYTIVYYWTDTEYSTTQAMARSFNKYSTINLVYGNNKGLGYTVRLIKDS